MPQSHRNVFTYISAFLRELLLHSNDNKLDAKTLGKLNHLHFHVTTLKDSSDWDVLRRRQIVPLARTHALSRARTYSLACINSLVHYLASPRSRHWLRFIYLIGKSTTFSFLLIEELYDHLIPKFNHVLSLTKCFIDCSHLVWYPVLKSAEKQGGRP